jgi:hypothetical protein
VGPNCGSAYRGLAAFEAERQRVFFRRADEIADLVKLLCSPAEWAHGAALFLVGPSGCGKSSLARAGLLPRMREEPGWLCLPPIVPGTYPNESLVGALAGQARLSLDPPG